MRLRSPCLVVRAVPLEGETEKRRVESPFGGYLILLVRGLHVSSYKVASSSSYHLVMVAHHLQVLRPTTYDPDLRKADGLLPVLLGRRQKLALRQLELLGGITHVQIPLYH